MKDYRISHQSIRKTDQYERMIYRAGSYDDRIWEIEQGILARELASYSTGDALDFACGTGRITVFLEDKVTHVTGVDIASEMIDEARHKTVRAEYIVADLTVADVFKDRTFNIITAFRFFLNAQSELREAALKVLVPKLHDSQSIFIANVHGNSMSYRFFTKILFTLRGRKLNTMSVMSARRLFRAHGLEVVRWYGIGVVPKFFYRFGAPFWNMCDRVCVRIPFFKYIAYDLVFVFRKSQ
ncbi:MAG: class I SAM-dependent methyltransferase [Patescibacteria group bacterium]